MMTIDDIKQMMEKACKYAEETLDLKIKPGNYGVRRRAEPDGSGCCCPVGALALYLKTAPTYLEFNYDPFVDAFDSDLVGDQLERAALGWTDERSRQLFRLGVEFRKKYVSDAPPAARP